MDEKMRVLTPIEIPKLGEYVDMSFIRQELNNYTNEIIEGINIQDLGDWKLLIAITSRATNGVGVFKRVKRYPSNKEFEVSISIPIPNEKQAPYGISNANDAFYLELNDKNFYILEPKFESYNTLSQYLIKSSKLAMDLAFMNGFTCNGKKIKFQK